MQAQSEDERLQQHFEAAQQAQQAGNLDMAASEYRTAIAMSPHVAELYANLGLVYYAQSKFNESAAAFATAAKLKPGLPNVNLWRGINAVKMGESAKAVPLLREAIRQNPRDLQAERFYGTALWNVGETFSSIDQLTKTCDMFPSDIDSFFVLADTYRKAADRQIEVVLTQSVGKPFFHQVYGDIHREQRAWPPAIAHYHEALTQDPSWKGAHLGLGRVSLAQDKFDAARDEFQQELKIDPDSAEAFAQLAQLDLLEGKVESAMPLLEKAIQISPYRALATLELNPDIAEPAFSVEDSTRLDAVANKLETIPPSAARSLALAIIDARRNRTNLSVELKQYEDFLPTNQIGQSAFAQAEQNAAMGKLQPAYSQLRVWLETHPNNLPARYLLAQVLKQLSLRTAARAIAMDPESPRTHQLLGQIYAGSGEDHKALVEYKLAEQANPSLPDIHYQIGYLEWQAEDREGALVEFKKELAINPYHAEANSAVGSILLPRNQPAEAIPYLETALRMDSESIQTHQQLGKAYAMLKDYKKAEAELLKAADSDLNGSVYYQLFRVYRAEGKTQEAAQALERCRLLKSRNTSESKNSTEAQAIDE